MHWSGRKTYWDRKLNRYEMKGDAFVYQPGETLTADYVILDLNEKTLYAKGNCILVTPDSLIYGEEMFFGLDTRTGTVINGRVSNERFSLSGERINKLSDGRFQTHRGVYSTCYDCPQSWSLMGDDVDLKFDGYAFMKNVNFKVKDAPLLWLPYLVVPVKSRRQTGFLFPRLGFSSSNPYVITPFYWAISDWADSTLTSSYYSQWGPRWGLETRVQLTPRSGFNSNITVQRDKTFPGFMNDNQKVSDVRPYRWAMTVNQLQELPWEIDQKFRYNEVSDIRYPFMIGEGIRSGDAYLTSELSLSKTTRDISGYVEVKRFRNLLNSDPDFRNFDKNTVQLTPGAGVFMNDRLIAGLPLAGGLQMGVSRFDREGNTFDVDPILPLSNPLDYPRNGIDPIRKATRFSIIPQAYTTFQPFDGFTLVPSLQYRAFAYQFPTPLVPSLNRGYLLFQTDLSTQIERIYETSDPNIPRIKHLIRPTLTYNRIPFYNEDENHWFIHQVGRAESNGISGYQFDSNDIVPIDTSRNYNAYFTPLGHSVSLALKTQVIRRRGPMTEMFGSPQRIFELNTGESVNIREFRLPKETRQPFTRYYVDANLSFDHWSLGGGYLYYPYLNRSAGGFPHVFGLNGSLIWERSSAGRFMSYDRSFNFEYRFDHTSSRTHNIKLGATFSLNDEVLPSLSTTYDLETNRFQAVSGSFTLQSPSQCWRFILSGTTGACPAGVSGIGGLCSDVTFDFSMNLTGSGFGGISELANQTLGVQL